MNQPMLEMLALSTLIRNVEAMLELYWDTENGVRLSQSLQTFRATFGSTAIRQLDEAHSAKARLVVDALCPACGFLNDDQQSNSLLTVALALQHAAAHGHVVILNGTADLPEDQDLLPA